MANPSSDDFRKSVVRRRDSCVNFKDDRPRVNRLEALRFYRGQDDTAYGTRLEGFSSVVSHDTMEAIESMMPSLVRPFVAGEEVVSFEPVGPEDEEGARQATDYINHVFATHNNAFRVVHDAMKDGLLYRIGIAKTVMEEEEDGGPETYDELDEQALTALLMQDKREPTGAIEQDKETGLYKVTLAPQKLKRYRVHIVAPDEFLYEERLASLDQATFLGHSKQITLGDLIDMGVDAKKAKELSSGRPETGEQERDVRFDQENEENWEQDDLSRPVWVDECYIRCDYAGKGLSWRKVLLGGAQSSMLSNEEAEGHPYSVWTPIPIAHKLVGMSIHDLTRDIQMNKTAVQRELNNAMYLANRPMRQVLKGAVNMDELLNPQVGGIVQVRQTDAIANIPTGGDAAFTAGLQMIEYMDGVREARTGVTRYNQGMDSNSLNKTATGMNIIASASQQRQELVARQFSEFLKDVFKKLLGLVMQHGEPGDYIRLRGKWVEVDPSDWKSNYDMTVSVGLGTNNKDQLVGQIQSLLQIDAQIIQMQGGVNGPIVTAVNVYEKLKRLQEAMGLKGDKYYTDPGDSPEQGQPGAQPAPQPQPPEGPPPPDPTKIATAQIQGKTAENVAHIRGVYDLAKTGITAPPPEPTDPSMEQAYG
jgi:hypothetical protein